MSGKSEFSFHSRPWEICPLRREVAALLFLCVALFLLPSVVKYSFPRLPDAVIFLLCAPVSLAPLFLFTPRQIALRRPGKRDLLFVFLALLFLTFTAPFINFWWEKVMLHWQREPAQQDILSLFLELGAREKTMLFVFVCIVTPVLEELLFRRLLYGLFLRIHPVFAVVATSLIFSAAHFFLTGAPVLFLYGIVFQLLFLLTKNLAAPMILHLLLNSLSLLAAIAV